MPLQMGVREFIAGGHLSRHVRKMRGLYGKRRQLLLNTLEKDFGKWLEPIPSFYGMHIAATARKSLDLESVVDRLQRRNVKVHTLRRYYMGPQTEAGLVFGYGAVDLAEMRRGLALLRQALPA
jgi:GntR family transcriptional regulator/MocR family aminotransferase